MGQHENHVRLAQQSQCRGAVKGGQSGPVWKNPRPYGKGRGGRHAGRALKGCLLSRSEPYAREAVAVPHRHSFVGAATDCTCGCGDGLTPPARACHEQSAVERAQRRRAPVIVLPAGTLSGPEPPPAAARSGWPARISRTPTVLRSVGGFDDPLSSIARAHRNLFYVITLIHARTLLFTFEGSLAEKPG